jgi:hypothetical protein
MFATLQVTVADGRRAAPTSTPLHTVITRKLTSLPWCSRGLLLEVTLHNLLNLDDTLLLASRRLDTVQCVRRLDEHGLIDDNVLLVPLCWKPVAGQSSPFVLANIETYVLLTASKISCASLLTPLPFCSSLFFISRIVCSSLASSAAMSTFAMLGTALSNPTFVCCPRSPRPMISKDSMCAKGMM